MILALLVIASIAAVSATKTVVAGKIYDSPNFETAKAVTNANVNVTCNQSLQTTKSLNDGTYSVVFNDTADCPNGSEVTVVAELNGVTSDPDKGKGIIHDYTTIADIYLGVVNIALIPEFGLFVGGLTILAAVGIFFFVRRK